MKVKRGDVMKSFCRIQGTMLGVLVLGALAMQGCDDDGGSNAGLDAGGGGKADSGMAGAGGSAGGAPGGSGGVAGGGAGGMTAPDGGMGGAGMGGSGGTPMAAQPRGQASPPTLGVQIDRMGRPAIGTAL